MRGHRLGLAVTLLASAVQAQPGVVPLRVGPVPPLHADVVVRAVAARNIPPRVPATARPAVDGVVALLRANKTAEARAEWTARVVPVAGLRSERDVDALVQWVLRESYLETNRDLKSQADKVRYYDEVKQELSDELARARAGRPVTGVSPVPYRADGAAVRREPPRALSAAERDRYVSSLEEKLRSIGDDAQLASMDLQSVLQKQQQTLQTIASVSKMLHDSAMAIIRKIGG